jgi:hypothetical protein
MKVLLLLDSFSLRVSLRVFSLMGGAWSTAFGRVSFFFCSFVFALSVSDLQPTVQPPIFFVYYILTFYFYPFLLLFLQLLTTQP